MPERELRGIRLRNKKGKGPTGDKPEGTYTVEVWCNNCEWEGEVELPKGTAVPWAAPLERLARCGNCGCETLERYAEADEEEEVAEPRATTAEIAEADTELADLQRMLDEHERRHGSAPSPDARPRPSHTQPPPAVPSVPSRLRRPYGYADMQGMVDRNGDSLSDASLQRMQDVSNAFEYSHMAVKTDYEAPGN